MRMKYAREMECPWAWTRTRRTEWHNDRGCRESVVRTTVLWSNDDVDGL